MREMVEKIDDSITEYKGIRIGDMITSYYKGYYVVLGFAPYGHGHGHLGHSTNGPMQCIHKRVADSTGQPCSSKPRSCAVDYCKKVTYMGLQDDEAFERETLRLKYCALRGIHKELEDAQFASDQAR